MLEKEGEKMHCVLIVEDDSDINNFINDYFVIKGYATSQAFSGTEGLLRLKSEKNICCVILDLMLPGISGEEIIQEIRKVSDVPIITVSAKNEEEAKIEVLKLGADDFLLKPFNLEELQLKVERNIQKYLNQQVSYKKNEEFKNIILNQDTREVFVGGQNVYFTSKEFDILMLLIQNPNKVISKEKIFKEVWHEDYCIDTQTVTVHIKNIRKKIKEINPTTPTIETVWGIGFKIC
ncbi:MAG: response regulator transcription factor [Faecalibacillus intestinalis]|uniref:response regulator transcription factor n=1 Tax=Faecalibacillus intestinalis TaxID=1982626 RepID=UPI00399C16B3